MLLVPVGRYAQTGSQRETESFAGRKGASVCTLGDGEWLIRRWYDITHLALYTPARYSTWPRNARSHYKFRL